jgi:hypothetical protein
MLRCPFARWHQHKGPKESFPARSYNIIVNHRRQILSSTSGHPSRWNDKTLALHDSILRGVSNNKLLSNYRFNLFKKDEGIMATLYILSTSQRGYCAIMATRNGLV